MPNHGKKSKVLVERILDCMRMRSSMLYLGAEMTFPHSSTVVSTKLSCVSVESLLSVTLTIKGSSSQRKYQYCSTIRISNINKFSKISSSSSTQKIFQRWHHSKNCMIKLYSPHHPVLQKIQGHHCSHLNYPKVRFDKQDTLPVLFYSNYYT